jgi:aryl-alcohol dehydrogenase-like predicted oxidoreductase
VRLVQLPGTDLQLSPVTFGAGDTAGLMIRGTPDEQHRAVARAIDLGINHFDTSSAYGQGTSEVNLGNALRRCGADLVITTKVYVPPEALLSNRIAAWIIRTVEGSLLRLGRESIDILLLHNPVFFSRTFFPDDTPRGMVPGVSLDDFFGEGGVRETLLKLRSAGKIRYFGTAAANTSPAAVTKAIIGSGAISLFNQQFNLINPSAAFPISDARPCDDYSRAVPGYCAFDNVIEYARSHNVGALAIAPLGTGVLVDATHRDRSPPEFSNSAHAARFAQTGTYERQLQVARYFLALAGRYGMTLSELAYRFVLSAPGVTTVLGGFSSMQHVEQAVAFAEKGVLTTEMIGDLTRIWLDPDATRSS